jgi:hypothetical protein
LLAFAAQNCLEDLRNYFLGRDHDMAEGEQKSNRESKKPKREKVKTIAAAPGQKVANWQPTVGSGKKK